MRRTDKHWLSHFVYSPIGAGIAMLIFGVPMFLSIGEKKGVWLMVGLAMLMFTFAFLCYRSYRKEEEREIKLQMEKAEKERLYRQQQEEKQQATIKAQQTRIQELQKRLNEREENNANDLEKNKTNKD